MASEHNDPTSMPCSEQKLCANNCGFWGNPTTMDLCSKCYKDFCLKEQRSANAKAAVKTSFKSPLPLEDKADSSSSLTTDATAAKEALATPEASAKEQPQPKAPANRCAGCNKKVGLTGFKCRCGATFCGAHRYPESHDCTFDFKEAGRGAISKANPVVKADKVEQF